MHRLGLRTRLLLAFVATAAVTLAAAALALLSPLQQRLREQERGAVRSVTLAARSQLSRELRGLRGSELSDFELLQQIDRLGRRVGGRATLYDPGTRGVTPIYPVFAPADELDDVYRAFLTRQPVVSERGDDTRIAVPLAGPAQPPGRAYVLAVRVPDTNLSETVGEVRDAFVTAAVIGLGVALAFALVLSATLSRRLGRLRSAALRIMRDGMDAPTPRDAGRDEVGDLARAMAAMQAGLRRQEAARRRFVATASHELRTPLTSLSGTLELLHEDLDDGPIDREDLLDQVATARGELARLRNLATELLDLSRLDAGVELRSEPVELDEVARAVVAEFAQRARTSDVRLAVVPPPGPCWAKGDPDAVARIVRILLDNALRYAPPETEVRVVARYEGERTVLAVEDEGPGVPAGERAVIFERFQRGANQGGEGGFGLGLAIGRELAERLGGTLALDSAADRPRGARFVLTLPIELPVGGSPGDSETSVTQTVT